MRCEQKCINNNKVYGLNKKQTQINLGFKHNFQTSITSKIKTTTNTDMFRGRVALPHQCFLSPQLEFPTFRRISYPSISLQSYFIFNIDVFILYERGKTYISIETPIFDQVLDKS